MELLLKGLVVFCVFAEIVLASYFNKRYDVKNALFSREIRDKRERFLAWTTRNQGNNVVYQRDIQIFRLPSGEVVCLDRYTKAPEGSEILNLPEGIPWLDAILWELSYPSNIAGFLLFGGIATGFGLVGIFANYGFLGLGTIIGVVLLMMVLSGVKNWLMNQR